MKFTNCVRQKGERKPNFVFASCVFRVIVPVYGYAEFFEIAVRTVYNFISESECFILSTEQLSLLVLSVITWFASVRDF